MSLQNVRPLVRPSLSRLFDTPLQRLVAGVLPLIVAASTAAAQNGTITGRITEALSGQPVGNATINALRDGGSGNVTARSAADGKYTLTNLSAGTYTVTVTARIGLAQKHVDGFVVRAGQTATLDFVMAPIAAYIVL